MTVKEYCNSCQNKGSHKCHSCCGKYYDGVLQGKPTKYRKKQQTNADRIRAMSDEELAKEFADCAIGLYCDTRKKGLPELPESVKQEVFDSLLEWLKQPAEGE